MLISYQKYFKLYKDMNLAFNPQRVNLPLVLEIKYLGATAHCNLNFESHLDCISKRISKKTGIFKRIS